MRASPSLAGRASLCAALSAAAVACLDPTPGAIGVTEDTAGAGAEAGLPAATGADAHDAAERPADAGPDAPDAPAVPDAVDPPQPALCLTETDPDPIGRVAFDLPGLDARRVEVVGQTAYVASSANGGLQIVDLSGPDATLLGTATVGTGANDLVVDGDLVYLADTGFAGESWGLDPTHPGDVAWMDVPGADTLDLVPRALAASGSHAYLGSVAGEIAAVSLVDPAGPTNVGLVVAEPASPIRDIKLAGDRMFVRSQAAITIYDLSDPGAPDWMSTHELAGTAFPPFAPSWKGDQIAVSGERIFTTGGADGANFKVLDAGDPSAVSELFAAEFPWDPLAVAVQGQYVYILTSRELTVRGLCGP